MTAAPDDSGTDSTALRSGGDLPPVQSPPAGGAPGPVSGPGECRLRPDLATVNASNESVAGERSDRPPRPDGSGRGGWSDDRADRVIGATATD